MNIFAQHDKRESKTHALYLPLPTAYYTPAPLALGAGLRPRPRA
jgi:hypothetical protein